MFEVGFTEILLILGMALLVLGPEKLPGLAQKVGRWVGRARSMAHQLRTQLEQEVTLDELAKNKPTPASHSGADADTTHGNSTAASAGVTEPPAHSADPSTADELHGTESSSSAARAAEPAAGAASDVSESRLER